MEEGRVKHWRIVVEIAGMAEPMVDWYDAPTMSAALALWDEDAHRYGIPVERCDISIRLATEKEANA